MLANYHKQPIHTLRSFKSCLRVFEEVSHFEFATEWLAELVTRLILLLLLLLLLLLFLPLLFLLLRVGERRRRWATADVATAADAAVDALADAAGAAGAAAQGSVDSVKPIPVFIIIFWAVPSTLCHVTSVLFEIALTIQIVV